MKIRDGFYMPHYEGAGGARYRTEARREGGPWVGQVYLEARTGSSARHKARFTIDDGELVDPTDGDEVCDLILKRSGLKAKKSR